MSKKIGSTATTLPNGTLITTAEDSEHKHWGADATLHQQTLDIRWLYENPRKHSKEAFPWAVCSEGIFHAADGGHSDLSDGKVLSSWDKGDCPDLPQEFTVGDLADMADSGYVKGVERLAEFTAKVADKVPVPESIRSRYRWSDEGDDYDILRTYAGDFEHAFGGWQPNMYRGPRVVTLYIPVGGHCGEKWDNMFWRAAAGVAVSDVLSNAGFAVEIYGAFSSWHPGNVYTHQRNLVKKAGEHMNLASVAYATSMTAFFRVFGFPLNAFNPWSHSSGWGSVRALTDGVVQSGFEQLGWLDDTAARAITFGDAVNEEQALRAAAKGLKQLAEQIDLDVVEAT